MNRRIDYDKVAVLLASTPPQSFPASVALRRPDNLCAVAPLVTRVKHHEERRRNASLVAGAVEVSARSMAGAIWKSALEVCTNGDLTAAPDNPPMSSPKTLFGFHAVGVRLKTAPASVIEIHFDTARRDARMRSFIDKAQEAKVRLIEADGMQLAKLCGGHGHQGVVARVKAIAQVTSLDELLENLEAANAALPAEQRVNPLILVLDGVTDPHNLGACLRVADGAGVHAVIAPKDHAAGINATVAKVASGATETVPYFMVTNLARTLNELKERNIWVIGTSDAASKTLYQADLTGPVALVLGAEGDGMRQLTAKTCDELINIPMRGAVESLNVSVASGVCLYEAVRQRL